MVFPIVIKLIFVVLSNGFFIILPMEKALSFEEVRRQSIAHEKQQLFLRIIEGSGAHFNQVQKAFNEVSLYERLLDEKSPLRKEITQLKERLLQPEQLVRAEFSLRNNLLASQIITQDHGALAPLARIISDIDRLILQDQNLLSILAPVKRHYEEYLERLLASDCDKAEHIHPKVLLTMESFGLAASERGIPSYRISQTTAYSLISKDIYGFLRKKNEQGSHAVSFKKVASGGVHFKGNTAVNGLPVGMEAALYWLSQALFGHGLSASALVVLNEVEKKEPAEGSSIRSAYNDAILEKKTADGKIIPGKTADEFFAENPSAEGEFISGMHQYVLQASDHVEGISLETFIEEVDAAKSAYNELDSGSFSEQLIFSLLTNPSDGTPGNFMVKTGSKPYAIVGIDSDMALGPELVYVPQMNKHSLELKNILYGLPLMDLPVNQGVSASFQKVDPILVTLQWLKLVRAQERSYARLLSSGYTKVRKGLVPFLSQECYENELHLPLKFDGDLVEMLQTKIVRIQQFLKKNEQATHRQLFEFISPVVSQFYKAMGERYKNEGILEAFRHLCNSNYEELYIEDVVKLDISKPPVKKHDLMMRSVDDLIRGLIKTTDLMKMKQVGSFLQMIVGSFSDLINPSELPASWRDEQIVFKLLKERVSQEIVQFFLSIGADIQQRDESGGTLLHCALENKNSLEVIKLFLRPELIDQADKKKRTPLDVAMERSSLEEFGVLVAVGASRCNSMGAAKFYKKYLVQANKQLTDAFVVLVQKNSELSWMLSFEEMLPPVQSKMTGISAQTCHYANRVLPDKVAGQIIAVGGSIIPYAQYGNHIVARAVIKNQLNHELYFKVNPELPGIEEAVGTFTRGLIGVGASYTELIRLGNQPVLVSQGIQGRTLLDVMKNNPELLKDLDERDLSGLIIVAMLINPEDGKPDNYIVEPHPTRPGKYRLICVDNDHAFVPAIVKEKPDKGGLLRSAQAIVQVKTILYCLDQMADAVHADIRDIIINLDIENFLQKWLGVCDEIHLAYRGLFPIEERKRFLKENECFIGVPFQEGAIAHLYEKLVQLKDLLSQNSTISHIELLSKLEPRLARRYKEASDQKIPALERFKKVDAPFYQSGKQGGYTTVTDSGMILGSMNIPFQENVFEKMEDREFGPAQALSELGRIRAEVQSKAVDRVSAKLKELQPQSFLLNSNWSGLLKSLDFSKLTPSEQLAVLKIIQTKDLQELSFVNCEVLTDSILKKMKVEHVKSIDLRGCTSITSNSIEWLAKNAPVLEELNLSVLNQFKAIGVESKPFTFNTLERLNLGSCVNLKRILIRAPRLLYLNIDNCERLSDDALDKFIASTQELQRLDCNGAVLVSRQHMRVKFPKKALAELPQFDSLLDLGHLDKEYSNNIDACTEYYAQLLQYCRQLADLNDPEAQYELGLCYVLGKHSLFLLDQDFEYAKKLFQKSAEQGHLGALCMLGMCWRFGKGMMPDYDRDNWRWTKYVGVSQAKEFYEEAIARGSKEAKYRLGMLYRDETDSVLPVMHSAQDEIDLRYKGRQLLSASYEYGLAFCMLEWRQSFSHDHFRPHLRKLIIDAEFGCTESQLHVAELFQYCFDNQEAADYYRQCAASHYFEVGNFNEAIFWWQASKNSESFWRLGSCYYRGTGVEKDEGKAKEYWRQAADRRHPEAQYFLATLLENSDSWNAYRLYRGANLQGNPFAKMKLESMEKAMPHLLANEMLVEQYEQIEYVVQESIAKIFPSLDPDDLADLCLEFQIFPEFFTSGLHKLFKDDNFYSVNFGNFDLGFGDVSSEITRNTAIIIGIFEKYAESDSPQAQFNLALCYMFGSGRGYGELKRNVAKATEWCKRAADQGNAQAKYYLALFYKHGIGLTQDVKRAEELFKEVAGKGYSKFNMGVCYPGIKGYAKSKTKEISAIGFYEYAANQGHPEAQYNLGVCYMSGIDVPKDTEKAKEFFKLAVMRGHAQSYYYLGEIHENLRELNLARECYEKAALQGLLAARLKLIK